MNPKVEIIKIKSQIKSKEKRIRKLQGEIALSKLKLWNLEYSISPFKDEQLVKFERRNYRIKSIYFNSIKNEFIYQIEHSLSLEVLTVSETELTKKEG